MTNTPYRIKSRTAGVSLSGRRTRIITSFWKRSRWWFQGSGSNTCNSQTWKKTDNEHGKDHTLWGSKPSYTALQPTISSRKDEASPLNAGSWERRLISTQLFSAKRWNTIVDEKKKKYKPPRTKKPFCSWIFRQVTVKSDTTREQEAPLSVINLTRTLMTDSNQPRKKNEHKRTPAWCVQQAKTQTTFCPFQRANDTRPYKERA